MDSGVRACLAEEFSTIYVLNLRGNQRTSGERSRREGGKVFGQGSRAPVAITVLVRNPHAERQRCRILYRDIGDYLSREDKLAHLREWGSIGDVPDWQEITPDRHHDWIGQRNETFQALYPVGSKDAKAGKSDDAVFRLFSNGYKSGRDAYVYNFSRNACTVNARRMVDDYMGALEAREQRREYQIDRLARQYSSGLHWDQKLKRLNERGVRAEFSERHIRLVAYRPFVKQHLYAETLFAQRPALTNEIFPSPTEIVGTRIEERERERERERESNLAICLPGVGSVKPFSAIVVDTLPDLELVSKGQCFPRYRYEPRIASSVSLESAPSSRSQSSSQTTCQTSTFSNSASASPDGSTSRIGGIFGDIETELAPVDNITDSALAAFRARYGDDGITKDAIFDYVYGVLHAPEYRERFANDLAKELPRIPFAQDFHVFATAGSDLTELHLGYETCNEYPLDVEFGTGELTDEHFRLGTKAMRVSADGSSLAINEHVRLVGLPPEAHGYEVNGRTPLGWFIDRYRTTKDNQSGIVNDPNDWFANPRDLVTAIRRIVHVSVSTVAIVDQLPDPFAESH